MNRKPIWIRVLVVLCAVGMGSAYVLWKQGAFSKPLLAADPGDTGEVALPSPEQTVLMLSSKSAGGEVIRLDPDGTTELTAPEVILPDGITILMPSSKVAPVLPPGQPPLMPGSKSLAPVFGSREVEHTGSPAVMPGSKSLSGVLNLEDLEQAKVETGEEETK